MTDTALIRDVRIAYDVFAKQSGSSSVLRDVLLAVHRKEGTLDLGELWRLDDDLGTCVVRLVAHLINPSRLSDAGLSDAGLSSAEIEMLSRV